MLSHEAALESKTFCQSYHTHITSGNKACRVSHIILTDPIKPILGGISVFKFRHFQKRVYTGSLNDYCNVGTRITVRGMQIVNPVDAVTTSDRLSRRPPTARIVIFGRIGRVTVSGHPTTR